MEFNKISFAAVVLTVILFINSSAGNPKNHRFGFHSVFDKIIAHYNVQEDWKFFPKLVIEKTTIAPPGYVINMVEALDLWNNAACIQVKQGGLGYANVTMEFKSAPMRGLNIQVDVYAVKASPARFVDSKLLLPFK